MKRFTTTLTLIGALLLIGCGGSPSDSGDSGDNGGGGDDPPDQTEDTTPPSTPSGLEGNSGDELVELSWSANGEDDLDGYNLYRSESSFSDVSGMDPVNGGSLLGDTEFTDEGLQNGTTYYYRLTALDENENESDVSTQLEVTPFSDPPDRPKK